MAGGWFRLFEKRQLSIEAEKAEKAEKNSRIEEDQHDEEILQPQSELQFGRILPKNLPAKIFCDLHRYSYLDGRYSIFPPSWPEADPKEVDIKEVPGAGQIYITADSTLNPSRWIERDEYGRSSPDAMADQDRTRHWAPKNPSQVQTPALTVQGTNSPFIYLNAPDAALESILRNLINQTRVHIQKDDCDIAGHKVHTAFNIARRLEYVPAWAKCQFWMGMIAHRLNRRVEAARAFLRSFPCVGHFIEGALIPGFLREYEDLMVAIAREDGLRPAKELKDFSNILKKAALSGGFDYEFLENERRLVDLSVLTESERNVAFEHRAVNARRSLRYQRITEELRKYLESKSTVSERKKAFKYELSRLVEAFGEIGTNQLLWPWWREGDLAPTQEAREEAESAARRHRHRTESHAVEVKSGGEDKERWQTKEASLVSKVAVSQGLTTGEASGQGDAVEHSLCGPNFRMTGDHQAIGDNINGTHQRDVSDLATRSDALAAQIRSPPSVESIYLTASPAMNTSTVTRNNDPDSQDHPQADQRESVPFAPTIPRRPSHAAPSPASLPDEESEPQGASPPPHESHLFSTLPPTELKQRNFPKPAPLQTSPIQRRPSSTPGLASTVTQSPTVAPHPPSPLKNGVAQDSILDGERNESPGQTTSGSGDVL